jgi:hypothetical protein
MRSMHMPNAAYLIINSVIEQSGMLVCSGGGSSLWLNAMAPCWTDQQACC